MSQDNECPMCNANEIHTSGASDGSDGVVVRCFSCDFLFIWDKKTTFIDALEKAKKEFLQKIEEK